MKLSYVILIAICFAVHLSSCTWDNAEHTACPPDVACTNFGQDTISYSQDIVPIMTTYCTAGGDTLGDCHQATSSLGFDYTTYEGLALYLPDIFNYYVLDPATATMPKSITHGPTQLTCCDKEKLSLWIAQGFPNN
ncbi:MAG TPA: hypothetical protein VE978_15675 [Chitinophagales bacterium]|nr:hypothetical protein [Chitinophagales bacterium]